VGAPSDEASHGPGWTLESARGAPGREAGTEATIFEQLTETRSICSRVLSLCAAIVFDVALLGIVAVVLGIASAQSSARRLEDRLRVELARYRVILVDPGPEASSPEVSGGAAAARDRRPRSPAPAFEPVHGDRVLERLEPRFADFVRENPRLERLLTDEIARDVQRRRISGRKLDRTRIEVRFEVLPGGAVSEPRITISSGVRSVDALALELAMLLERYRILTPFEGLERIGLTIGFRNEVAIELCAEARDPTAAEEARRRVANLFGLLRLGMGKEEAAVFLDGVLVRTLGNRVELRKTFDRRVLDDFLAEVYGTSAPHPAAAAGPRP
jgi:hypothetical protein